MSDIGNLFENPKRPRHELPRIGQRVRVLCVKEMVYKGDLHDDSSDWLDDGEGFRGIMLWEEIKEEDEKRG